MPSIKRQDRFTQATPDQMHAYAQKLGFPSAHALAACVALGHILQEGQKITQDHVRELAQYWPNVPQATIQQYAANINSAATPEERVDMLIGHVYSPDPESIAAGRDLIKTYATESVASTISSKLDARQETALGKPSKPTRQHEPDTLRGDLSRALRAHGAGSTKEEIMASLDPQVRRDLLADRLEENIADHIAIRNDPNSSIYETLEMAWDKHEALGESAEELGTADIPELENTP